MITITKPTNTDHYLLSYHNGSKLVTAIATKENVAEEIDKIMITHEDIKWPLIDPEYLPKE